MSGCESKNHTKDGVEKQIIHGWKFSKGFGLISFVATPRKDGKWKTKHKNYHSWVAKITNKSVGSQSTVFCLYNESKGILNFPDFDWVANPKAPNGGYFGTNKKD